MSRSDVIEDVARHARERGALRDLIGLQVRDGELRLVVQHLLEVRHVPFPIGRVAVKSAAEMIVNAAVGDRHQRLKRHLERARLFPVRA